MQHCQIAEYSVSAEFPISIDHWFLTTSGRSNQAASINMSTCHYVRFRSEEVSPCTVDWGLGHWKVTRVSTSEMLSVGTELGQGIKKISAHIQISTFRQWIEQDLGLWWKHHGLDSNSDSLCTSTVRIKSILNTLRSAHFQHIYKKAVSITIAKLLTLWYCMHSK